MAIMALSKIVPISGVWAAFAISLHVPLRNKENVVCLVCIWIVFKAIAFFYKFLVFLFKCGWDVFLEDKSCKNFTVICSGNVSPKFAGCIPNLLFKSDGGGRWFYFFSLLPFIFPLFRWFQFLFALHSYHKCCLKNQHLYSYFWGFLLLIQKICLWKFSFLVLSKLLESYVSEYKSFFVLHHFKSDFTAFCFMKICACRFF